MLKDSSVKILKLNNHLSGRVPAILSGIMLTFFILVSAGHGQTQTEQNDKKAPLHVTSDQMIALKETSMVEFVGNVRATHQDSVMLADSIKVYFNETSKTDGDNPQSNVKKIVSTGNVRYTAGDRQAFADQAVYTAADETLVLTGKSPKLQTGESFVTGKKITLYRNDDKVLVESDGSQRVEALFNPEDNEKKE